MQERGGPRPFDVATRGLIETDPVGWLTWLGLRVDGPVRPLDSEVSAVLAEVDKVLRVDGPSPWLAHLEFQASYDPRLPERLDMYRGILRYRYGVHVRTIVVLLRPLADGRLLTGRSVERDPHSGDVTSTFTYRVARVWEQPAEDLLNAGLGVLPLAPLGAHEPGQLPEILDRLDERFAAEGASPSAVGDLWAATSLLMGVRYDRDVITALIQKVRRMRESVTYQLILEEGREEGREEGEAQGRLEQAREMVLDLGAAQLGAPPPAVVVAIRGTTDLPALQRMARAVLRADNWDDILAAGQT